MSERASESASTAREQAEALEVLREVWSGQRQGAADLDGCETGACKRMTEAGVGFDDFGGETEQARASWWRARLEREGKLASSGGSLRDVAFGTDQTLPADTADR